MDLFLRVHASSSPFLLNPRYPLLPSNCYELAGQSTFYHFLFSSTALHGAQAVFLPFASCSCFKWSWDPNLPSSAVFRSFFKSSMTSSISFPPSLVSAGLKPFVFSDTVLRPRSHSFSDFPPPPFPFLPCQPFPSPLFFRLVEKDGPYATQFSWLIGSSFPGSIEQYPSPLIERLCFFFDKQGTVDPVFFTLSTSPFPPLCGAKLFFPPQRSFFVVLSCCPPPLTFPGPTFFLTLCGSLFSSRPVPFGQLGKDLKDPHSAPTFSLGGTTSSGAP